MKHEAARKIVETLDREIRHHKRGIIATIGKLVSNSKSWWHGRFKAGDLTVVQLMTILDFLWLDPLRFMREALGRGKVEVGLQRPKTKPPTIVKRAVERMAEKELSGTPLDESFLKILDEIRYEQPHKALRQAEWAVEHLDIALLPRFLGVTASILRHLSRLDEAEHALFAGIGAEENEPHVVAELMQRLAYVVADKRELENARFVSVQAMAAFLYCGDAVGMARTMVDQGKWLSYMGRPEKAIQTAKVALRYLPETETVNRCAAYHLLAHESRGLGLPKEALEYVMLAKKAEATNASLAQDKIQWLMANIEADLGNLNEAEALMTEVFDRFCQYRNGEDALLVCDLVRVQLQLGKGSQAHQTAKTMMKLLEPLRHDKTISAAIADLLRIGQEGLTLALVNRVQARIESELRATINAHRVNR